MALVFKDRVQETSSTTGTGTLTLGGAVSGYQTFSSAIGNTNTTYYTIVNDSEWEVGIGTVSAGQLSRDTVLESSNANALVNFSAGTKYVFCTYAADKTVIQDESNKVSGYAIENSTIGATTASTGRFTSVTTPSVTATTNDLTLSAISTGAINFNTVNGKFFAVTDGGAASANYWTATGNAVGNAILRSIGTGANAFIDNGSANSINFRTNGAVAGAVQAVVSHTTSAVNYVQVTGAATTGFPAISAQGSDTNIGITYAAKGSSRHVFTTGNGTQFRINDATSSVNTLETTGAATGLATRLYSQGSDTNISLALLPKGTGAIDLAAGSSGVNISNGGTVTSITRTATGSAYSSAPTVTVSPPTTAGGVQATANALMGINIIGIVSGGTGYTLNNVLTLVGGTGTVATLTVTGVTGGVINAVTVGSFGSYSVVPTNNISVTGGTGTGATFTSTWAVGTVTVGTAGSGYIEQPTVTFSGGGGSGAAAYAAVGTTTIARSLGGTIQFHTPGGTSLAVVDNAGALTNHVQIFGSAGGSPAIISSAQALVIAGGTNAGINFYTNRYSQQQFVISHTASAVNYVQVTGGATGQSPTISAQGSDANINLFLNAKGTGNVFAQIGGANVFQAAGSSTSANRILVQANNAGTSPAVQAVGSDTNIDLALTPKGTGLVRFGTYVAGALTATGYINIKAADGTTYKVLVST